MVKAYNRPEELPDDHRQFYRNLNKTAVDDYNQYVAHVESQFAFFFCDRNSRPQNDQ